MSFDMDSPNKYIQNDCQMVIQQNFQFPFSVYSVGQSDASTFRKSGVTSIGKLNISSPKQST